MGWGEAITPDPAARARELENLLTRVELVASGALRKSRVLPLNEAAPLTADALRAICKLLKKPEPSPVDAENN